MTIKDPFPMSSAEAKRMAASTGGVGGDEDWSRMGTRTERSGPGGVVHRGESGETLLAREEKEEEAAAGASGGDIYEEAEMQESRKGDKTCGGLADDDDDDDDDEFLDRPLEHGGSSWLPRWLRRLFGPVRKLLKYLYTRLYGKSLPVSELLRTLTLGMTLFTMIGGYWLLRSLKDPVITAVCGVEAIPKAKMLSVVVVLAVVTIYNKLLDYQTLPKHHLFYIFGTVYFFIFGVIAAMLDHPQIGIRNTNSDPSRLLGWVSYCSIESFGSVMVSLFWSFANSNTNVETAKSSYGVLVATAQLGSILGPTVVKWKADSWGVPACYRLGAACMIFIQLTIYGYVSVYGTSETSVAKQGEETAAGKKKERTGILEGLRLFVKYNYVKGIFAISCLFMVEVTIVDYFMKFLAKNHFAALHPCGPDDDDSCVFSQDATKAMTTFMGLFGQATNGLSFFMSLLGTSAVIRYLGLRLTLLLFPTVCLLVIILVRLRPTLYVVFASMMILKASSYSLNNPTKEILYQPTSGAVKYKAKSWIDIFGARGSKALGSVVTNTFSSSATNLVHNGSIIGMMVASFLIWNATYMGRTFDTYMETGYVVGAQDMMDDDDQDTKDATLANAPDTAELQNDNDTTSCAFHDDDKVGTAEEGQEIHSTVRNPKDDADFLPAETEGLARVERV